MIIEGNNQSRTEEESYIYDAYKIQQRMTSQIAASWPIIKQFSENDFKELYQLYEQNKVINAIQNKTDFIEGPDCVKIRNNEVDQCFRYFVYDLGECWFGVLPNPGCYYSAVKDQYRCNKSAEANYQNCKNQ
ncbi:MAG: hypothetical protein ACOYVG_15820 [Bacteroidota bacterium]